MLATLLRKLLLSFEGSPASLTPARAVGLRVAPRSHPRPPASRRELLAGPKVTSVAVGSPRGRRRAAPRRRNPGYLWPPRQIPQQSGPRHQPRPLRRARHHRHSPQQPASPADARSHAIPAITWAARKVSPRRSGVYDISTAVPSGPERCSIPAPFRPLLCVTSTRADALRCLFCLPPKRLLTFGCDALGR